MSQKSSRSTNQKKIDQSIQLNHNKKDSMGSMDFGVSNNSVLVKNNFASQLDLRIFNSNQINILEKDISRQVSTRRQSWTHSDFKFGNFNSLSKALPDILGSQQLFMSQPQQRSATQNPESDEPTYFKANHARIYSNPVMVMRKFRQIPKFNKSLEKSSFIVKEVKLQMNKSQSKIITGVKRNIEKQLMGYNQTHNILTSNLKMISKEVIEGINLNYIIMIKQIEELMQQSPSPDYQQKNELVYVILETLNIAEKNIIGSPSKENHKCQDKIQLIHNNLQIFGTLVGRILIQLSKVQIDEINVCWSQICDTMWNIFVQMMDSVMQIIVEEKERDQDIVKNSTQNLQEQIKNIQFQNQTLQNEIIQINKIHKRLQDIDSDQIYNLQEQLKKVTREYQQFKLSLEMDDHPAEEASGAMQQLKSKLKDFQQTIKTLEVGVFERESIMSSSLTGLVHFHKSIKKEETSVKSIIELSYGLSELTKYQASDLEQVQSTLFSHPFYNYLAQKEFHNYDNIQQQILENFKIDNVEEFLIVWFNKISHNHKENSADFNYLNNATKNQFNLLYTPSSLLIKYIKSNIQTFMLKNQEFNALNNGNFIIKYQITRILNFLTSLRNEEYVQHSLEEKKVKQFCLLFCQIFGVCKIEGISMKNFIEVLTFYQQCLRKDEAFEDKTQFPSLKENKLNWDISLFSNLIEKVQKYEPNRLTAKNWLDGSTNLSSLLLKIAAYLEKKDFDQYAQLFTEIQDQYCNNKLLNQTKNICIFLIDSLTKHFNFVDFDDQMCNVLVLSIHDRCVKINLANSPNWREFNPEQCDHLIRTTLDLIWAVYKKSPKLMRCSFKTNFMYLKSVSINKLISPEKQVKYQDSPKSVLKSQDYLVNLKLTQQKSSDSVSIQASSPDRKSGLFKLLTNKVSQFSKMQKN